jgi:hypothetical protein
MIYPSIIAHSLTGVLLFVTVVIVLLYFTKIQALDIYHIVVLLLLFTLVVGVHGVSHALLEKQYGYFPLWKARISSP